MNAKTKIVKFNNQQIPVYFVNDQPFVAMKPICENIGLNWNGQFQRIKRNHILSKGMCMIHTPTNGGNQEVVTLPFAYLNGWLFGIDANKVKPEIKDTLVKYQLECYDVLYKYFMPKPVKQINISDYVPRKDHDEMVLKYHRLYRKYDDSIDVLRNQVNEMQRKCQRYDTRQQQRAITIERLSINLGISLNMVIEQLEWADLIEKRAPYIAGAPLIWMLSPRNRHLEFVIIDSVVEGGEAKDQIKLTEEGVFYVTQLLENRLKRS